MRLTCPNCKAQYEVDGAVIPEAGRDVQCSNCGQTWFQLSESALAVQAQEDEELNEDWDDEPSTPPLDQPAPKAVGAKKRTLDSAVLDVLREEAEREVAAREAEGSTIPTGAAVVAPAAPESAVDEREAGIVTRAQRRELLPDIEEINSTLRASSERSGDPVADDAPQSQRQRRDGFRRGFVTGIAAIAILWLPYLMADVIRVHVPALGSTIDSYQSAIDAGRVWLDRVMKSTTDQMNGTSQG